MRERYQMNKTKWIVLLLGVLFIVTFIVGYQVGEMRTEPQEIRDTLTINDTIRKTDTFNVEKLVPKIVKVVKRDTVYNEKGDTIELKTEQKTYIDTLCQNQDSILLKTTISGINAKIDSMQVSLKKQEIIKTNTITVTKYIERPKTLKDRIHLQPQATFGYDVINKNCGFVVGIGVGIDI